ncbi:MAG: hypothetical protein JSV43_04345 [Methanobacteriota archaeon]|nr:MAG: hypothetical protein JSV43_04345 [Euryarchaeota archaeon]
MAGVDFWGLGNIITVLLLYFALFLVITGAFTAYFGSGKSRKIGAGLLVIGLVIGILWSFLCSSFGPLDDVANVGQVIVQSIGVLLFAVLGAAAAIGLFLLAIMKS